MNQEGMDDRYYFADWGGCTCDGAPNLDCPYWDGEEDRCTVDDEFEEEEEDDGGDM